MSIRNLEYKAKERTSKLGQQRWFYTNLATTITCASLVSRAPWLQSLQSCDNNY